MCSPPLVFFFPSLINITFQIFKPTDYRKIKYLNTLILDAVDFFLRQQPEAFWSTSETKLSSFSFNYCFPICTYLSYKSFLQLPPVAYLQF